MAFKKDIFQGSQFIQGYGVQTTDLAPKFDDRFTSAVRVGNDDNNSQTIGGLQSLINEAEDNFSFEYPYKDRLYLHRIVATQDGGEIARAFAYYEPVRNILYDLTPGTYQIAWHRTSDETDLVYPASPVQKTVGIYTISFKHRYYQNSCPDLKASSHNKINSASYTLTNLGTFTAKQLLFLPPRVTSYIAGETTIWEIEWRMVGRGDGWIETYYNDADSYAVAERDMYASAAFPTLP